MTSCHELDGGRHRVKHGILAGQVLPNSRTVVDRATLTRHLLTSPTDPFTRAPLSAADAQPLPELRTRIAAWQAARRQGLQEKGS